MITFMYSAAQKTGAIIKGEKDADNEKALAALLKQDGLFLLYAEDSGKKRGLRFNVNIGGMIAWVRPVSIVDKMMFARNLSVMVNAGLSLTRALDALAQETTNPKFQKAIKDIIASVSAGKSFAESLRSHITIFGPLFSNMVEVGETTGKLALILKLLASQMQKDNTLRKRVRGAMMYPAVIITVLFCIGALMMIFVIPTLTKTIEELHVELPISTKIVIAISHFMVAYAVLLPVIIAVVVIGCWRIFKLKRVRELFDRFVLKFPIFGPLIRNFSTARFCRILAYLIMSGVSIVRSLEITSSVLNNTFFKKAAEDAARQITTGKPLNEILASHPDIFHHIVIQMVQVGEETGKVSEMLMRLAMFFEEEVANTTKNMSTLIEPLLMVVIGAAVGFLVISILQPIYGSLGNI